MFKQIFIQLILYISITQSIIQEQGQDLCNKQQVIETEPILYKCEQFCQQLDIKNNSLNQILCHKDCVLLEYQIQNVNQKLLEYLNCGLQQYQQPQIRNITEKQDKNDDSPINIRNIKVNNRQVVLLDFSYYKTNSKEYLVKQYLRSKGLTRFQYTNKYSNKFFLNFVFAKSKINWKIFKEGEQLVNHLQNNAALTTKMGLVKTLREFDRHNVGQEYTSTKFFAQSFIIDLSEEGIQTEESEILKLQPPQWWILKPNKGFGGNGIKIIKDIEHFQKYLKQRKEQGTRKDKPLFILQKYMMNPLLVNNKKFDLRYFVIVPSAKPFFALLTHGFIRKGLYDYKLSNDLEDDDFIHITNVALQRQHPDYEKQKNDQIWLIDKFENYLKQEFNTEQIQGMFHNMKKSISYTLQAGKQQFILKQGMFQFFTFDFVVDSNLDPQLIEVNGSPSWVTDNEIYRNMKEKLFTDTMDLVIFLQQNQSKIQYYLENYDKLKLFGDTHDNYEVLVNDATGYNYYQEQKLNEEQQQ